MELRKIYDIYTRTLSDAPTIYDNIKYQNVKKISNDIIKKLDTYDRCMKDNKNDVNKCIFERQKLLYYLSIPA